MTAMDFPSFSFIFFMSSSRTAQFVIFFTPACVSPHGGERVAGSSFRFIREVQSLRILDPADLAARPEKEKASLEGNEKALLEIAEAEIERTAQEAVKAALVEVGGELAYEKERADELEKQKLSLEAENKRLKEAAQKKKDQFFYGALIGGTGGVIVTSLVFGLLMGVMK